MVDEKIIIYKRAISEHLKPVPNDYVLGPHDHLVIDNKGNLYELSLADVRAFNGSSWQYPDERELYGKAITYWTDFIDISFGGGNTFYISVSNAVKPTEVQVKALLDWIKMIHKRYRVFWFTFDWRWHTGGGNAMGISYKLPGYVETKLKECLNRVEFKGINPKWYEVINEG